MVVEEIKDSCAKSYEKVKESLRSAVNSLYKDTTESGDTQVGGHVDLIWQISTRLEKLIDIVDICAKG